MQDNVVGDYVILTDQRLGVGSFGEAYKCYKKGNRNEEYCIKIIKKSMHTNPSKEKSQKKQLEAEINTFQCLKDQDCENLVKMIEFINQPSRLCIIMELCEYDLQKDLIQYKINNIWPSRLEIIDMMKQILKGAQALIRNHIIHRDIKLQNILVQIVNKGTPQQRKIYKIADFGFTKYLDDIYAKANLTRVGTRSYCAPEILNGKQFSCKCDVYSYGIVFHQIVYKMDFPHNYSTDQQLNQYFNIIQQNPYKCQPLNYQYGDMITNLIENMLIYDQDKRISFEELSSHEIMTRTTPILKDSIFLPIQRTFNQQDYQQEMLKNEASKFQRLNLLIEIFYRKFLLCKYFVDFMKQNAIFNNIEFLIFQQFILLIGCQQIIYGFAMMNCIISDLELTIVNDNDVPQLIELLTLFMKKSQQNKEYIKLQEQLTNDYYQSKITYQQDLNKLYQLRVEQNWQQNQAEFKYLQRSKIQKIPIQDCCTQLKELTQNRKINDWITKCDMKMKQCLQTIKQIDTQFDIAHYRIINPDDIFKI